MSFFVYWDPASMTFDGDFFTYSKKLTMTLAIPVMTRPHEQTTSNKKTTAGRLVGSIVIRCSWNETAGRLVSPITSRCSRNEPTLLTEKKDPVDLK